ncbi:hypothetical protein HDU97_002007 [Phlyctochytrium planicorne]|nr:hypothetical protein HDU97_002007 [Phlyctochytrium planicorne]
MSDSEDEVWEDVVEPTATPSIASHEPQESTIHEEFTIEWVQCMKPDSGCATPQKVISLKDHMNSFELLPQLSGLDKCNLEALYSLAKLRARNRKSHLLALLRPIPLSFALETATETEVRLCIDSEGASSVSFKQFGGSPKIDNNSYILKIGKEGGSLTDVTKGFQDTDMYKGKLKLHGFNADWWESCVHLLNLRYAAGDFEKDAFSQAKQKLNQKMPNSRDGFKYSSL